MEIAADLEAKDFLNQNFIERFVHIRDSDYDDIRRTCRATESAEFELVGKPGYNLGRT